MKDYTPGRGSKRAVEQFTFRQGMWIIVVVTVPLIVMLLLWLGGYLKFDVH
jgi:hypothetical protein